MASEVGFPFSMVAWSSPRVSLGGVNLLKKSIVQIPSLRNPSTYLEAILIGCTGKRGSELTDSSNRRERVD